MNKRINITLSKEDFELLEEYANKHHIKPTTMAAVFVKEHLTEIRICGGLL